jgi:hypothetical protein
MGKLREFSDKVSDVADKYGLANPIEVVDEALGGQTREESKKRRDEAKDLKDRESIRVDRSPKYSDSQMDSTRKLLEGQAKAFKQERDKASEDYDKAIDKNKPVKKRSGGKVSASSRADGCAIRGKTKGRMV